MKTIKKVSLGIAICTALALGCFAGVNSLEDWRQSTSQNDALPDMTVSANTFNQMLPF